MQTEKPSLWQWLKRLIFGRPHFAVGGWDKPYLLRWYLIPRNRWFNVYLHKFLRDDDDRALHDHTWPGIYRIAPSLAFRRAEHRHRVELSRGLGGRRLTCWTLVITGRKVREWGFWCPKGFVPWHQFVDSADHGNIGRGCE